MKVWTVYELATACPGRFLNTGHMKFNDCLCVKGDINKSVKGDFNKSEIRSRKVTSTSPSGYKVLSLTGTDSRFVRKITVRALHRSSFSHRACVLFLCCHREGVFCRQE